MLIQQYVHFKLFTGALMLLKMIICYPIENMLPETEQAVIKNETRFANGTVVGQYVYNDRDGNPINVNYFADDTSYGIELKSLKIMGSPKEDQDWKSNSFDILQQTEPNVETTKIYNIKQDFKSKKKLKDLADYDRFYRNDIKGLKQCDKDKVRVYLDREKKLLKRALDNYEGKSCGRY